MKPPFPKPGEIFTGMNPARPLTLEEVLRLRDGREVPRGHIPRSPFQLVPSHFKEKEWLVLCVN